MGLTGAWLRPAQHAVSLYCWPAWPAVWLCTRHHAQCCPTIMAVQGMHTRAARLMYNSRILACAALP